MRKYQFCASLRWGTLRNWLVVPPGGVMLEVEVGCRLLRLPGCALPTSLLAQVDKTGLITFTRGLHAGSQGGE